MATKETEISKSAGCVVVLEPGAGWPEQAFALISDREGVAIVHESPEETADSFFRRLAKQFAQVAANGVLIGTVLIACSSIQTIDRTRLAAHVQQHALFAPNGAVIFVAQDRRSDDNA